MGRRGAQRARAAGPSGALTPAEALAIAAATPWEVIEPTFDLETERLVIPDRFAELGRSVLAQMEAHMEAQA